MTLARIDWNLSIGAGGSVANKLREGGDFEQKLTKENEGTTLGSLVSQPFLA